MLSDTQCDGFIYFIYFIYIYYIVSKCLRIYHFYLQAVDVWTMSCFIGCCTEASNTAFDGQIKLVDRANAKKQQEKNKSTSSFAFKTSESDRFTL